MQIYLVGGAVRDSLLNLPVTENDWVVVGCTPEEMLKLGYKPVGKDFPVFLHPETHEEYALARTERKSGRGYTGFTFHTSPDVTLEEDLRRRDLTINAMAMTAEGKIIDPYGGRDDLRLRVLRHVSPAFVEDPVRILRVARFMARLQHLNFTIDKNTQLLMKQMVDNGEVDALVPNRVWREFDGALGEKNPLAFFEVLDQCGALIKLFPEIKNMLCHSERSEESQKAQFKRFFAQFTLSEANGPRMTSFADLKIVRFAVLFLPLKIDEIQTLCKRYPVPTDYRELSLLANKLQELFYKEELDAEKILFILDAADVWRREDRFLNLMMIFENSKQNKKIMTAYESAKNVTAEKFIAQGLFGKALGEAIQQERLRLIKSKKE